MLATLTLTASTPSPPSLPFPIGGTSHLAKIWLARLVVTIYNALLQSEQDCRVVRVAALALQSPLQHTVNDIAGDSMFYGPARNGDATPVELCANLFQCFQCHAVARILVG